MTAGESARELARARREKAERLARQADLYELGAVGESATAAALGALNPNTWIQLHDVRWPGRQRANIDHVVIGPPGVFVVDTKNWSGRITTDKDCLRQNGRSREATVAGCADAAIAVSALLTSPFSGMVTPVLCFVRDESVAGWVRDVMMCSTHNVVNMLETRPSIMSEGQIADAARQLRVLLTPASQATATANTVTRDEVAPPSRSARTGPGSRPAQRKHANRRTAKRRGKQKPSIAGLLTGLTLLGAGFYGLNHPVQAGEQLQPPVNTPSGDGARR